MILFLYIILYKVTCTSHCDCLNMYHTWPEVMLKSPIVSGLPLSYIATSLCVSSFQVCVCVACVDACSLMAVVYPLLPSSPCMFGFPTGKARRGMWLGHEPSTPSCTPCCDVCRHKASRMLPSYSTECWGDVGMISVSVRPTTSSVWVTVVIMTGIRTLTTKISLIIFSNDKKWGLQIKQITVVVQKFQSQQSVQSYENCENRITLYYHKNP